MPDLIHTEGPIELQAQREARSNAVRVRIRAYSGGVIRPPGWGDVVIDFDGLDLPEEIVLLADHGQTTDRIAGGGRPVVVDGALTVLGTLTESTEAGRTITQLLRDKVPLQASVGLEVHQSRGLREGEEAKVNGRTFIGDRRGLRIVESGALREVSLLPIGADRTSRAVLASWRREMPLESNVDSTHNQNSQPTGEPISREQFAELLQAAGGDTELLQLAVDEGLSPDAVRRLADRNRLEATRAARPRPPATSPEHAGPDANETAVLTAGVLRLLGRQEVAAKAFGERAAQAADDLRCNSVIDLAAHALRSVHADVPRGRDEMLRAAFSSTSLATALGSAAEKISLTAFQEAPRTWEAIARRVSAANFREHTGVRLAGAVQLNQVGKGGEIEHGTLDEETVTYQVSTFARMVGLTRQDIINDDLALLEEIPAAFGRAASRKIADLAYTVLLANGDNFFHADHDNLLTGAESALSVSALGDAMKALRNQTDADGMPIDITPRTLLVPPSLEGTAREVLNSVEIARDTSSTDRLPTGNPWRDSLGLQVEPRLESSAFTGSSAAAWYLFGSSQDGALLVAGLNGRLQPTIEQQEADFNKLGMQWRCYIDLGAALGDWRAAVKAAGQ